MSASFFYDMSLTTEDGALEDARALAEYIVWHDDDGPCFVSLKLGGLVLDRPQVEQLLGKAEFDRQVEFAADHWHRVELPGLRMAEREAMAAE